MNFHTKQEDILQALKEANGYLSDIADYSLEVEPKDREKLPSNTEALWQFVECFRFKNDHTFSSESWKRFGSILWIFA